MLFIATCAHAQIDPFAQSIDIDTMNEIERRLLAVERVDSCECSTLTCSGLATFNAGLAVKQGATGAGFIDLYEDSDDGTDKLRIQSQAMASDFTITLPADDGDSGQYLQTNGSGTTDWETVTIAHESARVSLWDVDGLSGSGTVSFDSEDLDTGNDWDTTNDDFTAPVTGEYFVAFYCDVTSGTGYVQLEHYVSSWTDSNVITDAANDNISGSTIISLNAGEKIRFEGVETIANFQCQTGTNQAVRATIYLLAIHQ